MPDFRYVLVKADLNQPLYVDPSTGISTGDVYQVYPQLWTFLTSLNGATASTPTQLNTTGFPTMDNDLCPPLDDGNGCMYVLTDKNYALFAYDHVLSVVLGSTFAVKDPFFTKWKSIGSLLGLGSAVTSEQALTSPVTQNTATAQTFRKGQLFSITTGTNSGRLLTVGLPIYDYYVSNGGPSQYLGFPTSDELLLPDGRRRQSFEGGSIEYNTDGQVTVLLPVDSVNILDLANPLRLKVGDTARARVVLLSSNGTELSGRTVSWRTTNGRVVTVEPFTGGATLLAIGGGTASVTAISEGKSSYPLTVSVAAQCCQPGEGAPTAAINQAFDDAVTRNKLPLQLPGPSPVRRVGAGYIQEFTSTTTPPKRFLLTVGDAHVTGYYLTGDILSRYDSLGGPLGALGYPATDPNAAGRQLFDNKAALAGDTPQLVSGSILDRWAAGGYESGALGMPLSEAVAFSTFAATSGLSQSFRGGLILSGSAGPLSGKTVAVLGTFRAKYLTLGGPAGNFGMATADETVVNGARRQEFEGGFLEQAPGGDVVATDKPRQPSVSATPSPALAGGKVRVAVGGFPPGSALKIKIAGQASFTVAPESGSYAWSIAIPATARSETVAIQAATADETVTAQGSYTVRSLTEGQVRLTKVSGDNQTGLTGALVLQPLKISLRDSNGNPAPGVPVTFQASPSATVQPASATTDPQGEALAALRLPPNEGIALVTAAVPGRVVTFSAKAASGNLANFPKLTQNLQIPLGAGPATIAEKGALLASVASILRFMQDQGDLPGAQGTVDVVSLNRYLTDFCAPNAEGADICDGFLKPARTNESVVNLWRVPGYAGGGVQVSIEPATVEAIRDALGQGVPTLLALNLSRDGEPVGSHFVAAIGVAPNGGIAIYDPGTLFGRSYLNDFLGTFTLGGHQWSGKLASVIRFRQAAQASGSFMVYGNVAASIVGPSAPCAPALDWLDSTVSNLDTPLPAFAFSQTLCEGTQPAYQIETPANAVHELTFVDQGSPGYRTPLRGQGATAYRVSHGAFWGVLAQRLELADTAFVNPASLTAEVAPGGLISVVGSGLSGGTLPTTVRVGGQIALIVTLGTFRLTALLPAELAPGIQPVEVQSQFGTMEASLEVLPVAPAIFERDDHRGVVYNATGVLNTPDAPAIRGQRVQVYGTGFGPLNGQALAEPLVALVQGRSVPASFSGMATGMPGVYTVELVLPADLAPSDRVDLRLLQGGRVSNTVEITVQ